MKKSVISAVVLSLLVFGASSPVMAAGNPKPGKVTCAQAKVTKKQAVTKAQKKAATKLVAKVCKPKKN